MPIDISLVYPRDRRGTRAQTTASSLFAAGDGPSPLKGAGLSPKVRGAWTTRFRKPETDKTAITEVLTERAWQRCHVHFLRNARDYLARKADDDYLQELRWLYDRRDLTKA